MERKKKYQPIPGEKYLAEFPKSEFQNRISNARSFMNKEGIDALIIAESENLYYFSGFKKVMPNLSRVRTYAMHCLILPIEADPILVVPMEMRGNAESMTWIDDVRFFNFGLAPLRDVDPFNIIDSALHELSLGSKRNVGLELGEVNVVDWSQGDFDLLKQHLVHLDASIVDASSIIWKLRSVKSEREIDIIRKACEISCKAMKETLEYIHRGMTEKEVARFFYKELVEGGIEDSVLRAFLSIKSGPCRYGMLDSRPSDVPLSKGDIVVLDGGAQYKGYNCDLTRVGCVGEPSTKQRAMFEAARKAEEAALDAVRAGVSSGEVHEAADVSIKESGFEPFWNYCGHNIGLVVHEPPFVQKGSKVPLEEGAVLAIEPPVCDDVMKHYVLTGRGKLGREGIFYVEDNVVVRRNGYANLTNIDKDLYHIR